MMSIRKISNSSLNLDRLNITDLITLKAIRNNKLNRLKNSNLPFIKFQVNILKNDINILKNVINSKKQ